MNNMKRCSNGHFYNFEEHSSCPYCEGSNDNIGRTVSIYDDVPAVTPDPEPIMETHVPNEVFAEPQQDYIRAGGFDSGKTVGIYKKEKGFDPVVGWLVCVEGASVGKDFRIKAERNFIGRSPESDICINGDNAISSNRHAIISYNPKEMSYRIGPGDSRGIVYLNDKEVFNSEPVYAYDIIEIGQTKLMFIPFCGERFAW